MAKVSSNTESLSGIGWKEEWLDESHVHTIVRLENPTELTNQIVYTLSKFKFPKKVALLKFLERLLPEGYSLPDSKKFSNLVVKVEKQRAVYVKQKNPKALEVGGEFLTFSEYKNKPFFEYQNPSPVSHLRPSENELSQLHLETVERNFKRQKLDLDALLKEERSKSASLAEKVNSLTQKVNDLELLYSSQTHTVAGLKGKLSQEIEKTRFLMRHRKALSLR